MVLLVVSPVNQARRKGTQASVVEERHRLRQDAEDGNGEMHALIGAAAVGKKQSLVDESVETVAVDIFRNFGDRKRSEDRRYNLARFGWPAKSQDSDEYCERTHKR